jgi:ABC-type transport system involved in cytochrome c biogenesis ATPase subunit
MNSRRRPLKSSTKPSSASITRAAVCGYSRPPPDFLRHARRILSVHDLACARGERLLFKDMNFSLGGRVVAGAGRQWSGQNQFAAFADRLARPEAGEVRWRGESIRRVSEAITRQCVIWGMPTASRMISIRWKICVFPMVCMVALSIGKRAVATLEQLGLSAAWICLVACLSFGQRRRVALAALLLAGSTLWILDEPLTGLDVHAVALMEGLIRDHLQAGGMVVATTHQALNLEGVGAALCWSATSPFRSWSRRGHASFPACRYLRRDLTLAARRRGDWMIAQFFFVMVASLFPLGVGPEPDMLARIGPGVLWVAATLASLLSLSRLFADDHHDGSLEHMVLSPEPTVLLVLGKSIAHWLIYGIPVLLIAPVLGIQFNLSWDAILVLECRCCWARRSCRCSAASAPR